MSKVFEEFRASARAGRDFQRSVRDNISRHTQHDASILARSRRLIDESEELMQRVTVRMLEW